MANDVGSPILAGTPRWSSARAIHTGNLQPATSAAGTDKTPVVTETYIAELKVNTPVKATGFALFNGSAVAGNVVAILYNQDGKVITKSASTAQAGIDQFQRLPFAVAQKLRPGVYYIGIQCNNTGARINNHPFGNFGASIKTGEVFNTATTITPPTTFTADAGPMGSLY